MLDEANQESWNQLETATSGSHTLLHSAERYGAYLANNVMDTDTPLTLVRENIGELMLNSVLNKMLNCTYYLTLVQLLFYSTVI